MQSQEDIWDNKKLGMVLENGGVAVMPTDTIYGVVGKAQDESVVNRIYAIRKRNPHKPCIILIGNIDEVKKFSIVLSKEQQNEIKKYWPGPVSIVLDCLDDSFAYLHRGTRTLAFRLPASQILQDLLLKVGPLIAPSANLETFPPNNNVTDAKKYFGDSVDMYVDGGIITGKASKIIKLHKDGSVSIIRE